MNSAQDSCWRLACEKAKLVARERASYPAPRTCVSLRVLLSREFSRLAQKRELPRRLVEDWYSRFWANFQHVFRRRYRVVAFVWPWPFFFIIILGEMLLTEITIKSTARQYKRPRRNLQYICFLRRKQLNHKILRVLNVNSFRKKFFLSYFLALLSLRIISYT